MLTRKRWHNANQRFYRYTYKRRTGSLCTQACPAQWCSTSCSNYRLYISKTTLFKHHPLLVHCGIYARIFSRLISRPRLTQTCGYLVMLKRRLWEISDPDMSTWRITHSRHTQVHIFSADTCFIYPPPCPVSFSPSLLFFYFCQSSLFVFFLLFLALESCLRFRSPFSRARARSRPDVSVFLSNFSPLSDGNL